MRLSRRGLFGLTLGIATAKLFGAPLDHPGATMELPAALKVKQLTGGFLVSPELLEDLRAMLG